MPAFEGDMLVDNSIYLNVMIQSRIYSIPPELVFAIITVESNFDPLAIGDDGESYGLMQVNLSGAGFGQIPSDLLQIDKNIAIGVGYLRQCFNAFGDWELAVAAYNQGITATDKEGIGNEQYVLQVLSTWNMLELQGVAPIMPWAKDSVPSGLIAMKPSP